MAKRLHSDSESSSTEPASWETPTLSDRGVEANGETSAAPSPPKHVRLDPQTREQLSSISCFLPPSCSGRPFASHEQFETHYLQAHTNRCLECGRNFPSLRFLELHIAENHDPLTELKRERGDKTYACFVEGCDRLCSAPHKRRMHLIAKHHFPKEYKFGIVKTGIDRSTSLLTRKRQPPPGSTGGGAETHQGKGKVRSANGRHQKDIPAESPEIDGQPTAAATAGIPVGDPAEDSQEGTELKDVSEVGSKEVGMDDVAASMASLSLVPTNIRFGRRRLVGFRR